MSQIILDSANDLIQGDFDNATLNSRTKLQTSTVNATTGVYVVPNGTATSASVQIANNSNLTNASKVVVATNGSTDTQIVSGANGSGTYLPLSFYTNNDIRFQMGNAGELNVRTAPGTVSSGTSGQVLTSGGPGAGVSWSTLPASGQIQTELFTAPGTWTKPASCTQVRVTVIGGGGGSGQSTPGSGAGGTSSFGSAISCTGGAGGGTTTLGAPGTGTVSVGTALRTTHAGVQANGILDGLTAPNSPTAGQAFSTSTNFGAGRAGARLYNDTGTPAGPVYAGGNGGVGIAIVPVSAPVSITIGSGGNANPGAPTSGGVGIGGAVLVEFVG